MSSTSVRSCARSQEESSTLRARGRGRRCPRRPAEGYPDRKRSQRTSDPPRDDRVLLAILLTAQQSLTEVIVNCGIRAACDRAGKGDRAGPLPVAADQKFGASRDEGCVAPPHGEHVAR